MMQKVKDLTEWIVTGIVMVWSIFWIFWWITIPVTIIVADIAGQIYNERTKGPGHWCTDIPSEWCPPGVDFAPIPGRS